MNGMSDELERDEDGRLPGAAAWQGDLTTASPKALEAHERGLVSTLGNLTVKWDESSGYPSWRQRTPLEQDQAEYDRWVRRLIVVRMERDRREARLGGRSEYVELLLGPDGAKPWNDADIRPAPVNSDERTR